MKFAPKQLLAAVPAAAIGVAAVAVVGLSIREAAGVPVTQVPVRAAVEPVTADAPAAATTAQDWRPVGGSASRRGY